MGKFLITTKNTQTKKTMENNPKNPSKVRLQVETFAETCQIISKILNISIPEAQKYFFLFDKINPTVKNCLYYLSELEDQDLKISAAFSLEFLVNFKKSPFE